MTDYTKLIEQLRSGKVSYYEGRSADAIEALQSQLGDAIQSSAHWQHQCTELQSRLDGMGKGEPVAWQFRTNGKHWHVVQVCPPDDAYDKGTLSPLYAAPKALAPHEDTKLLDYLQARQATVEILMDGHGLSTPLFRIGGLHGTICADIRGAIGAAIESLKEPTP